MKKGIKILGLVLGGVVVLVAGFVGYVAITGIPTYDPPAVPQITVDVTPERVARGEVIANVQCLECHSNKEGRLTGRQMTDVPEAFGKVFSKNITQDKAKGIGNWTDGELIYFLRTGIRKDGTFGFIMPSYPNLADEDLMAVIAWLRSDRFPVQASSAEPPSTEPSLFSKFLTHTVMKPLPYPQTIVARPDTNNLVALGKYTADAFGDCYACHSADLVKQDKVITEKTEGYYGGGIELKDDKGNPILTSNLTFDEETGIAKKYTKEQFIKVVRLGVRPDGSVLRYPMSPKLALSEREVGAIYEYLKTVPKIHNDVAAKAAELQLAKK